MLLVFQPPTERADAALETTPEAVAEPAEVAEEAEAVPLAEQEPKATPTQAIEVIYWVFT